MTIHKNNSWSSKVYSLCIKYNIPINYLAEIMLDPKVMPMLRGKAFEYSVLEKFSSILDQENWVVDKVAMNAQYELHDEDITVTHKETSKKIRIECKLSDKESYRCKNGVSIIRVKCMRSRTLGENKIKTLAPKIGIPENVLKVHNDQYTINNFDFVVTSIANAFYRTDKKTGLYEWKPTEIELEFLKNLSQNSNINSSDELKSFAFNKIYIAKSTDLHIVPKNSVLCTRRTCTNKSNCGFIPNYPIIKFNLQTKLPYTPWYEIEHSLPLFKEFVR